MKTEDQWRSLRVAAENAEQICGRSTNQQLEALLLYCKRNGSRRVKWLSKVTRGPGAKDMVYVFAVKAIAEMLLERHEAGIR